MGQSRGGTKIREDWEVVKVKRLYNGYGRHIVIRHGFGYETLYAHLSKSNVRRGDKVKRGQVIGLVGSTGTSTSSHLHYEVHKLSLIHI